MNKLQMAHDWYMKHSEGESYIDHDVRMAWEYANAMHKKHAEDEAKKSAEVREMLQGKNESL